jgi:K+-transporting ATPase KdpF subunit
MTVADGILLALSIARAAPTATARVTRVADGILLALSIALFVYLGVALVKAERF